MVTLDEAINHAREVADKNKKNAEHIRTVMKSETALNNAVECEECAKDHEQLADWLTELKALREFADWLLKEQYSRRDSLFGDGIRYCAERLERKWKEIKEKEK